MTGLKTIALMLSVEAVLARFAAFTASTPNWLLL